ncbi:transglutaminaseTgpA domain-containing protein [Marinicellulosiphila megalodicopiae]|uniref:transglutaminase family protein n=1 Tax=Marinicellulosiphila megalodicopiae TaxID=2724896 RepID=UPI003BAE4C27
MKNKTLHNSTLIPKYDVNPAVNPAIKIWLILALIVTWLPFLLNMPITLHGLLICIITFQGYIFYKNITLSSFVKFAFVVVILSLAGLFSLLHYSVEGIVSFSLLAVFFKILEINKKTDIYVLMMSLLFVSSTACILDQSLIYGIWLVVNMTVLLSVMVAIEHQTPLMIHKILGFTFKQMLICVPLMLIVFLMFPRINAFWSVPGMNDQGTTGLSDSLNPGSIASLAQSNQPAFRVTFNNARGEKLPIGEQPNQKDLYWRAMTLDHYDGKSWTRKFSNEVNWENNSAANDQQYYQVIMQPSFQKWMMLMDSPVKSISKSQVLNDQTVQSNIEFSKIEKYDVISSEQLFLEQNLTEQQKQNYLALPKQLNPRTFAFSNQLMQDSESDSKYIQKILTHFSLQKFYYTLSPGKLNNDNQIDQFLFETKEGFCSHYASTLTVMARMQGIPARIVGGYLGGEYNEIGGFWQINQKQAHAWVEVYINEHWQRVDPTSSVALTRIEQGMDSMFAPSGFVESIARSTWMIAIQQRMDAMNYAWQNKVLNYSANNQSDIVRGVGRWWNQNFKKVLLGGFIFSVMVFLIWVLRKPIVSLFLPMHVKWINKIDKKLGQFKPNQSMEDKLALWVKTYPKSSHNAEQFLTLYLSWRFSSDSNITKSEIKKSFRQLIST